MTYEEAREFINGSNQYGCVPGLETITQLLKRLGDPQEQLKIIHVAGTNGKGSTQAFISTILSAAGYRVGRYISPAVFSYRERIQISQRITSVSEEKSDKRIENIENIDNIENIENNHINDDSCPDTRPLKGNLEASYEGSSIQIEYITEKGICDTIEIIKPACEWMLAEGFSHPTSFEIETAMAMLYLLWEKVDFAVIEVGLGGRMDATNVIKHPVCSIITSISMDHMQYLGDTLEQIAREKAGIIKRGSPVVTCRQETEVMKVLEEICKVKETHLTVSERSNVTKVKFSPEETVFTLGAENQEQDYKIKLLGEHQVENAILAIKAAWLLRELGYSLKEDAIKQGLYNTKWSGRFEVISRKPYLIIDGAHNEAAALVLYKSLQLYFTNRKIIYMIGVLADKDYKSILKITAPLADVIITLTPNNSRALSATELAKAAEMYSKRVIDAGDVDKALRVAFLEAKEDDVIIAFGSLSFLGDLVRALEIRKDDEINDR